jgi:hypothetical protein
MIIRSCYLRVFLVLSFISVTLAHPLTGSTPAFNPTNHGDPNLRCQPTTFSDIALFYLANYFAHCLTVKTLPGESALASLSGIVLALFFPTSGVVRAVNAIIRNARFGAKDEIHGAARAGALCMIIRTRI